MFVMLSKTFSFFTVSPVFNLLLKTLTLIRGFLPLKQDSKILIEQNKTAYEPPGDIPFEEFGKGQTLNRAPQSVEKKKVKKPGWFGGTKKNKKV